MPNLHKPIQRNNTVFNVVLFCVFLVGFIAYATWISPTSPLLLCMLFSTLTFWSIFGPRLILLIRECFMWNTSYSSYKELLFRSMDVKNWQSLFLIGLITVFLNCFMIWNDLPHITKIFKDMLAREVCSILDVRNINFTFLDILICISLPLNGLFQWDISSLTESYRLEEKFSFSGGSCMALGYFYGYLKLILSDLPDKVIKFQDRNKLQNGEVPEKKLFILIPSSSFIFDKLRQTDSDTIEPLEERLEPHEQHRGMVMNRVYKNTMYKIRDKNKKIKYYVPLEGASPLKTFYETCSSYKEFKEFKQEVISSFYYTLESLLSQDRDLNGLAELIYYDDERKPNIEISELVNNRIQYLKKAKKRKEKGE